MAKAKKWVVRILGAVVALLVVLLIVVSVWLGPIVKQAAETAGPLLMGVPIQVHKASIYPLAGTARIQGLVVGAPEGFTADLMKLDSFSAKVRLGSLFTDTIVIKEIKITAPEVTYELSGLKSNVGALLEALSKEEAATEAEGSKDDKSGKPDKPAKKVVIEHFLFEKGKVRLATTFTGGKGVVLPLPKLEKRDIGKEKKGVSVVSAMRETSVMVLTAVLTTVRDGVASVAGLGVEAVEAIAGSAGAALQSVGKLAGEAISAVGSAAADGAKAVGSVAVGGAKAVGGAVKSIGGLLSGKTDEGADADADKSEEIKSAAEEDAPN